MCGGRLTWIETSLTRGASTRGASPHAVAVEPPPLALAAGAVSVWTLPSEKLPSLPLIHFHCTSGLSGSGTSFFNYKVAFVPRVLLSGICKSR